MDFFDLFRFLVDMTGSSLADIARSIVYDRSYISKWYNRKALPAQESWEEICQKLADYFVNKMTAREFNLLAESNPLVKIAFLKDGARATLMSILGDAYSTSRSQDVLDIILPEGVSLMLEGSSEIVHMLYQMIDGDASTESGEKQFYFSGDIMQALTPEIIDELRFPYTSNMEFGFHYIYDAKRLSPSSPEALQRAHHFFRLAAQLPFIHFVPYIDTVQGVFQFCFEDILAAYGNKQPTTDPDFKIFITQDMYVGSRILAQLTSLFSQKQPAVQLEMEDTTLRQVIETSKSPHKANLYMQHLPLYWSGDELRQKLYAEGAISQEDNDGWKAFIDMKPVSKLENAVFIMPQAQLDLALNGVIKLSAGHLHLEGDNKTAYVRNIRQMIAEKEAQGEFVVIPKDLPGSDRLPECIIYSDGQVSFYLQPNRLASDNALRFVYSFKESLLAETVYHYLQALGKLEAGHFTL